MIFMENQLLSIINEMLEEAGLPVLDVLSETMHLRDDLNMDSFMLAEFTVRIESKYGVDIFEDGIVQTVGDVIHILNRVLPHGG
jgi:acyl carrier protein